MESFKIKDSNVLESFNKDSTEIKKTIQDSEVIAHESLQQAQRRYKKYYDRNANQKKFQEGDEVLIMLPTDANKLLMQWKGPFKIEKKMGPNDFKIRIDGKSKVYHANMLKKYTKREEKTANVVEVVSAAVVESSGSTEDDVVNDEQLLELNYLKGKETYRKDQSCKTTTDEERSQVFLGSHRKLPQLHT